MCKAKCLFILQHASQDRSNGQSFILLQAEVIPKTLCSYPETYSTFVQFVYGIMNISLLHEEAIHQSKLQCANLA